MSNDIFALPNNQKYYSSTTLQKILLSLFQNYFLIAKQTQREHYTGTQSYQSGYESMI
jgi:hypothetical protein